MIIRRQPGSFWSRGSLARPGEADRPDEPEDDGGQAADPKGHGRRLSWSRLGPQTAPVEVRIERPQQHVGHVERAQRSLLEHRGELVAYRRRQAAGYSRSRSAITSCPSARRVAEATQAQFGEVRELMQLLRQDRRAHCGQPVGPAPVDGRQGFDEPPLLEPGERRVQRARSEGLPVPASTSVMMA
jgi:hypothetical protein